MLYATMKQGKSLLGLSEALSVATTNVDTWLDLKIKMVMSYILGSMIQIKY